MSKYITKAKTLFSVSKRGGATTAITLFLSKLITIATTGATFFFVEQSLCI